eukprot:6518142-Pyramimonas_sp.AAC.1
MADVCFGGLCRSGDDLGCDDIFTDVCTHGKLQHAHLSDIIPLLCYGPVRYRDSPGLCVGKCGHF